MREMRDSGIEGVGTIPQYWSVIPTKYLYDIVSGATPKSEEADYFDGDIVWVTPADFKTSDVYVSSGRRTLSQRGLDSCSATMIPEGSIVFSKRAPIGSVAISAKKMCTNQGCLSCVPKTNDNSKYYYYLMSILTENYNLLGTGTTFKEISASNFANFRLLRPPASEQNEIVCQLDTETAKVDALITNQQAQIEKLKQYKRSLITEVVTKGLDPDAPMKDSGVEWIGAIPVNWCIKRGKTLFREVDVRSSTGQEELLTVSQYTGITPRSQKNVNMFEAQTLEGYKICEIGDIAANTMWMWAGAIGVSKYRGVISPSYNIYKQKNQNYNFHFLDYLLRSSVLVQEYASRSTGIRASRLRLYPTDFLNIQFPIPPLVEQEAIAEALNKKCAIVDALIRIKNQKIEKLTQYKKSLIFEYVTGKREVA